MVSTKQADVPARPKPSVPSSAPIQDAVPPAADVRRSQPLHEEAPPIEEPGYGHGV